METVVEVCTFPHPDCYITVIVHTSALYTLLFRNVDVIEAACLKIQLQGSNQDLLKIDIVFNIEISLSIISSFCAFPEVPEGVPVAYSSKKILSVEHRTGTISVRSTSISNTSW